MTKTLQDGLVIISQGFVGIGFHAFACYRCYLQREGGTRNLAEEFKRYGLPAWTVWLVVLAEFGLGWVFVAGIVVDVVVVPTSFVLTFMMLAAVVMRFQAMEDAHKAMPAFVFGLLSAFVLITQAKRFCPAVIRLLSGELLRPVADFDNKSDLGFLCTRDGRLRAILFVVCIDVLLSAVTIYEYRLAVKEVSAYQAIDDETPRSLVQSRRSVGFMEALVS